MTSDSFSSAPSGSAVEFALTDRPILIVDDDEMIREFVKMHLSIDGFENIETAENGAVALEKVETFHPDLIILDMKMPVLDGFGVLKALRSQTETEDLPVLVTSALDTHEGRNEILRHGASNLLSKPIDAEIMLRRCRDMLERYLLIQELTRYRMRLDYELSAAREMQRQIVPSAEAAMEVANRYGCEVASHYQPSSELGGDFWGIRTIDDDRFMVFTADFSGHGVAASLNTFRLDAIIKEMDITSPSPSDFLANINASLYSLLEPGQFATMLCAIVEPKNNRLVYAGAAAPEPIFGNVTTHDASLQDGSGLLLGVRENSTYEDKKIDFPKGSFMFLFSDALFESPNLKGNALETDGVLALARDAIGRSPATPLEFLLSEFYRDVSQPLNDDLTAIWLSH